MLDPAQFGQTSVYDLLRAAAIGHAGIDQRFLHAIIDNREQAIPDLLKFAGENHDGDPVDLEEDLISLFDYFRAPEAIPFLVDVVRRDPVGVTDELIEAFVHMGQPALEPLLKVYEEVGEEEGGEVAFLIAALRVRDPRVLKILHERLDFDAADGALAMTVYGDPATLPALEKLIAEIPETETELRREIQFAIDEIRSGSQEPVAHEVADIFALYPERSTPAFEILEEKDRLELLNSLSSEYRAEAAASFINKPYSAKVLQRLLELAKTDADPNVRGRAWEALSEHSEEKEIRQALLAAATGDAPIEERSGAVVGLSQETEDPAVRKAVEALYELPEGRAKALEAMWRSLDRSFASRFPKHLDDPDLETKRQAIWGTGYLGIYNEASRLTRFFDDEDLRADALFAYALAVPAEISKGRMQGLLRKIDKAAGSLTAGESELVQIALDERLAFHGLDPVFFPDEEEAPEPAMTAAPAPGDKPGRNDPCPCGSGKKWKKCCGA